MKILDNLHKHSDLVLSWTFSMPWFPSWIGENIDLMKLKSKIPDRLYLGFSKLKTKWVIFNEVSFLDKNTWNIEVLDFQIVNNELEVLSKKIEDFLDLNGVLYWLEFNVYSEIPRWHWLWFSWVLSSLISSWVFLLAEQLDTKLLENEDFVKTDLFKNIYDLAFELEKISKYNNTNWENSFMSFIRSDNPILFSRDWEKYDYLDIFNKDEFMLPFDYYIIFSWNRSNTKKIESYIAKDKKKFDKLWEFLEKNILWNFSNKYGNLLNYTKDWFNYETFSTSFSILNIKLLNSFNELYEKSYSDNEIEEFISIINEHRDLISMVEWKSDFDIKFREEFYKNASKNEKLWIVPIYSWKMWGWFLVVTKEVISRDNILKTIENIKDVYPKTNIEFSSFQKEIKSWWIRVEHNLRDWVISDKLKDSLILKTINRNIIVNDLNEAISLNYDILLDTIKNKVYIKWEKLTSKDIHSQSTVVEILSELFLKSWEWVSNKEFSISTYTKAKSEMWWKIVYPMRKSVDKKLWKELVFELRWESSNFEIMLDFEKVNIWILEKINKI